MCVLTKTEVHSSVADPDPDPPDPHVFGPPGLSPRKKSKKKTLIPTAL
jgi:hypothetical protein